ncbi:MAG: hypothetical protein HUJ54_13610 [Erysipelotrichaceae bacterium]|nr:hypothetical protein [Erysipelotrichaceae bacterium]
MNKLSKKTFCFFTVLVLVFSVLSADPFNAKLTEAERKTLDEGKILIKKINYTWNMCLQNGLNEQSDALIKSFKDLSPKYLAEVIQVKPIKGNEDLPERLAELLNNVPDYAGIPYFSVRANQWYDLYSSAVITDQKENGNKKEMWADIEMEPFGTIKQYITIQKEDNIILYDSMFLNAVESISLILLSWLTSDAPGS